ncbi:hypothetical protein [Brevundimonas sp.]|uniref:alpha-glutamyl/putrescinyl thymine pyrophosphorylase clade 3 protein n=1 Tax=Brevundimonas sp. TaxID=1871086 RepID=UPI00248958E7|nr:hypothetical protein [Brevundimonas sp.]MDI1281304.1 hypothetical protein [Brevundimonas sp.]
MRPADVTRANALTAKLIEFNNQLALPGIGTDERRSSLVRQMIDSLHRVEYVERLGERDIATERADPSSDLFDPLKAAVLHLRAGDVDEAAWLVFLSTHFGFHRRVGWRSTRMVYGALGGDPWTWAKVSTDPLGFRAWFQGRATELRGAVFGNHRKYESIRVDARENLSDTIESYVAWVGANRGHALMFSDALNSNNHDPRKTFDALYRSMNVARFGRTGRFDYLTMVGKIGVVNVDPPHPYFGAATGPVDGARLLFTGSKVGPARPPELSAQVVRLGDFLGLGMQVMEDSLCNWQKSPGRYTPFRG